MQDGPAELRTNCCLHFTSLIGWLPTCLVAGYLTEPCPYIYHSDIYDDEFITSIMAQPNISLKFKIARNPEMFFRSCRRLATSRPPAVSTLSLPRQIQCRRISTTSSRQATAVLKNPRMDEDGKEMTIEISERAAKVNPILSLREGTDPFQASQATHHVDSSEEYPSS